MCSKGSADAPLPLAWIILGWRQFSFTGVDYCGQIMVTASRSAEKRWTSLFTCLTTEAICLEVAHSLTTQTCLMTIRRFVCHRGKPVEFCSNNETSFQGAGEEILRKIDEKMRRSAPPCEPQMGGLWNRLV